MRTLLWLVLVLFLCSVLVMVPDFAVNAEPNTIVVPDDYSTIQEAINNVVDGDTVFVKSGVYYEYLVVNKSISLVGESEDSTTVYRGNQSYPDVFPTMVVRADDVKVTGFTIKNNVSFPSRINPGGAEAYTGVHLLSVRNCELTENIMINSGYGIWLFNAHENNVSNNKITDSSYGILVDESSSNLILGNTVSNCSMGIVVSVAPSNTLRNNVMVNNYRNFGVSGSELQHFLNDIDTSNQIDGKKVHYLVNERNLLINPVSFPDLGFLALVNCTRITVQGLTIQNNYCGLRVFNCSYCTVINNSFSNNKGGGLDLTFVNNCVVSENALTENVDYEIKVDDSESLQITRNNMTCIDEYGILISRSTNISVVENSVNESVNNSQGVYGVYLKNSNNTLILRNQLSVIYGFTFENSPHNLVDSNLASSVGLAVHLREGSDYCKLIGNTFTTQRGYIAVELASSFNSLVGNNILNFSNSIEASNSLNNVITGNTIESRSHSFQFYNFSDNLICRNNILGQPDVWDMGRTVHSRKIFSVNQWDTGIEGNYWIDCVINDSNLDGINENPYIVEVDNNDSYPLSAPVETFDVGTWQWNHYYIDLISKSDVSNFTCNPELEASIIFDVTGPTGTSGFCRLTIPKGFMESENWDVLIDGEPCLLTVNEDQENTYLNFTYVHSNHTIQVIGTTAIPEFSSLLLVLVLMVSVMVVTVFYKQKMRLTH